MARREVKSRRDGFLMRLVSAALMAPLALAAIYFGFPYFEIFIAIGAVILAVELHSTCDRQWRWSLPGAFYVIAAGYALTALRGEPEMGLATTLWLFTLVWAADTGAYLAGRAIGGPKLAPTISPNKTWAGFFGALISAAAVGWATGALLEKTTIWPLLAFSAGLGAVSQCGDLLESFVKRRFHKKDTSGLIPGHGGLFDRADGLLAAAIVAWVSDTQTDGSILAWL